MRKSSNKNYWMQGLLSYCLIMLSCIGFPQKRTPYNDVVHYTILKPDIIKRGNEFRIGILFSVEPGWYIYAPTGVNEAQGLIETNVVFSLPKGIARAGKTELPEPRFKDGHEVYEGKDIVISQSLRASSSLKPGNYEIKGRITWQTCNSQICLAPDTEEILTTIQIK